jgi:leader peptidase (prepilin peptidase)/N-methyltransferase
MHCGHTLGAPDLIPLLSYAYLRGSCRYCRSRISLQYPAVEAAAAALSVLIYLQYQEPLHYALALAVWLTLLFIVVYDLRHQIIPWSASGLLALLSFMYVWFFGFGVWGFAAGPLLAAPLFLLSLVSRGRWMGWGDGPLELCLGWLLGITAGLTALFIAFWAGAVVGIALLVLSKGYTPLESSSRKSTKIFFTSLTGYTMKSEVPFAPFLILGAACAYFLHVDFFQTLTALF